MTAFLHVPSSADNALARRTHLATIAALFAEAEEPARTPTGSSLLQIAAALLLVLIAIADTVLVARPDVLSACVSGSAATPATLTRPMSL